MPKEAMMRFYNQPHRFYCGVDLHARTMYLCILDEAGTILFHKNLAANPDAFRDAIAPYRNGLVVAAECMFAWYWLADLCRAEGIPFVLGHALYMKAIHGGKTKNDKIDAHKIATLLRGGTLAQAYVYPAGMRETRDLLRRRSFLVRQRALLIAHIQNEASQYNLPAFTKKLTFAANREELDVAGHFADPSVKLSIQTDLHLIDAYDRQLGEVELYLQRHAKIDDGNTYHRLRSIPGVGKILALILLYEIHDIQRFPDVGKFLSYARLVRGSHESAGKKKGSPGRKIGNAHLKWAFGEAACLFIRHCEKAKTWLSRKEKKHGKAKALAILSAKLGRTVYHLWRKGEVFDENRVFAS
jgi:transposase